MNVLTELENAQAHKISELMLENNRLHDSVLEMQKAFTAMIEQEAKRDNLKGLRDAFAMHALIGLLASNAEFDREDYPRTVDLIATTAYEQADAMLKTRQEEV